MYVHDGSTQVSFETKREQSRPFVTVCISVLCCSIVSMRGLFFCGESNSRENIGLGNGKQFSKRIKLTVKIKGRKCIQ